MEMSEPIPLGYHGFYTNEYYNLLAFRSLHANLYQLRTFSLCFIYIYYIYIKQYKKVADFVKIFCAF